MPRSALWSAAALVVLSNLATWGTAALNRTGEPEAVLELTERELHLPTRQADNTALSLTLVIERRRSLSHQGLPAEAGWFDRDKLASIGFDVSRPVTAEHAVFYRRQPPRSIYAALEYEGAAWQRQIQEIGPEPAREPASGGPGIGEPPPDFGKRGTPGDPLLDSRLVPIDVATDPAELRRRHPDRRRVAIVEATGAMLFVSNPGQSPFVAGQVIWVRPGEINVPREWRRLLEGLQADRQADTPVPPREPRFRATVKWGRRLEPWIADIQLLTH